MSTDAVVSRSDSFSRIRLARQIIKTESAALLEVAERLGDNFSRAVDIILSAKGSVIVVGMGKAGLIAQKIAATLASTGSRSHFLHPGEAIHGDLGRIHSDDVVVLLSFSGETEEITRLLPLLREMKLPTISITRSAQSRLGHATAVTLELGPLREAGELGLAPTTSTTAMLALGDALALVSSRCKNFRAADFARFHPGGSLGRMLSKVEDHMRDLNQCRVANASQTVREILVELGRPGRRTGAAMLTDSQGRLVGIFTDSDLARLLENGRDEALDEAISQVMVRSPISVQRGTMMSAAIDVLVQRKISELPVIDSRHRPAGMIDVTDLVRMLPNEGTGDTEPGLAPPPKSREYESINEDAARTLPFSSRTKPNDGT